MTDTTLAVEIMWGDQTFRGSTAKCTVQALVAGDGPNAVTARTYPSKILPKHGHGSKELAARDHDGRYGQWYRNSLRHQDDVLLLYTGGVWINRRPAYDIGLFVRLRATGPFIQANFLLPTEPLAVYSSVPIFTGRGDVLSPEEVVNLGYDVPSSLIDNNFDDEELEQGLSVTILGNAIEEKPILQTVEMDDGTKRTVAVPPPPKRILRRRSL